MIRVLLYRVTARSLVLVVFETVLICAAVVVAAWIRLGADDAIRLLTTNEELAKVGLVALVTQICLHYNALYDTRTLADRRSLFTNVIQALAFSSFLLAVIYYWFPTLIIGRGVFAIAAFLIITLVFAWRFAFEWLSRQVRASERLLLIGTTPAAVALARELHDRRYELGVEIVGFVDADPALVGSPVINPGVVGTIGDIPAIVSRRRVDRVVVSLADARGKLPMEQLLDMKLSGVTFDHLASVYEEYTGKIAVENLRPSWLIFSEGFRKGRMLSASKRALDLVFAGVGLVIGAPLFLAVAAAVRLSSPGPVLYHQRRVGLNGKHFTIHKFRTMRQDAEAHTGPVWASKTGDPRVTAVGTWMRRTRLDELPQLWNVLKGDMSFVGPRPERPEFVAELTKEIPFYGQRHIVRPGITGWAQVRYTYGASVEDALQKLQFDLFYIKNLSIPLDLFIVLQTLKTVVLRSGA